MKYINGFFQLDIRENGVYAHLFPEKENGKKINVQEFADYLESCGIHDYDLPELNRAISVAKEECDIFVSPTIIPEVDEKAEIRISQDKMMAVIRFFPPSKKGHFMNEKEIMNELSGRKIKYGISTKIIQAYIAGRQFCRDIPIAKGKAIVRGTDAQIVYNFETNPTAKPKLLEDGSVDFHELNMFTSVKKGDLLAELIPNSPGEAGMDIYGNVVNPPKVKKRVLKYGKNICLSEDKLKIYSEVDGDVKLEGDTVFVSNTYVVPADVDTSTGDIRYEGNVVVAGNVRSGFRIEATGDIEVNGVAEGATLIAGGNIVLKRGVQGMGKAYLEAGQDIVTKFLESCTAKAGNTINTGSALHSELVAVETVIVSGRKGFLIGGTISAGMRIEASVIGNKMNTATALKVGVEPEVMDRYRELSLMIKEEQEEMLEQQQVLENLKKKLAGGLKLLPNQIAQAKQAGDRMKELGEKLEKESAEYIQIKEEIENHRGGKVILQNTIYPGVSIYISNRIYPVKEVLSRCQFRLEGADIVSVPI